VTAPRLARIDPARHCAVFDDGSLVMLPPWVEVRARTDGWEMGFVRHEFLGLYQVFTIVLEGDERRVIERDLARGNGFRHSLFAAAAPTGALP